MSRSNLIRILLNATYSFIGYKNLDEANYLLNQVESLMKTQKKEDIIFECYMFKFMKGFYHLIDGDIGKGKKLMKEAINLFKINEIPELVKQYEHYYKEAIKKAQEFSRESKVNDQKVDFRKVIKF